MTKLYLVDLIWVKEIAKKKNEPSATPIDKIIIVNKPAIFRKLSRDPWRLRVKGLGLSDQTATSQTLPIHPLRCRQYFLKTPPPPLLLKTPTKKKKILNLIIKQSSSVQFTVSPHF